MPLLKQNSSLLFLEIKNVPPTLNLNQLNVADKHIIKNEHYVSKDSLKTSNQVKQEGTNHQQPQNFVLQQGVKHNNINPRPLQIVQNIVQPQNVAKLHTTITNNNNVINNSKEKSGGKTKQEFECDFCSFADISRQRVTDHVMSVHLSMS